MTKKIGKYALKNGLALVGNIPFDPVFTKAMVHGQTIFEYDADAGVGQAVRTVWEGVAENIGQ